MQQIKFYRVTSLPTAESNQPCEVGSLYFVHDDVNNFNDLYVCTDEYKFESYSGHLYWSDGSDGGFEGGDSWVDGDTGESIDPSLYLPLTGGTMTGNINFSDSKILFDEGQSGSIYADPNLSETLTIAAGGTTLQIGQNLTLNNQVNATKFVNTNSSDDYVLLGGGGVMPISDFTQGDFLPLEGGTMQGSISFNTDTWLTTSDQAPALQYNLADSHLILGNEVTIGHVFLLSLAGVTIPTGDLSVPSGYVLATAFFETSDARKKDIKSDLPLDKCYDLIDKCQTVIYSLKDQTKEQVGMIAQEIEEFFPEVVATDEEGFKSLAYDRLVVICFKVLKDVIKRLEKLEYENISK